MRRKLYHLARHKLFTLPYIILANRPSKISPQTTDRWSWHLHMTQTFTNHGETAFPPRSDHIQCFHGVLLAKPPSHTPAHQLEASNDVLLRRRCRGDGRGEFVRMMFCRAAMGGRVLPLRWRLGRLGGGMGWCFSCSGHDGEGRLTFGLAGSLAL